MKISATTMAVCSIVSMMAGCGGSGSVSSENDDAVQDLAHESLNDIADTGDDIIPSAAYLCRPCIGEQDCMIAGAVIEYDCLQLGNTGRFCLPKCGKCPSGYICSADLGGYCVPQSGSCECTDDFVRGGFETVCYVENSFGRCEGRTRCTENGFAPCSAFAPKPEECNGQDDDCDGLTDEEGAQGCAPYFYDFDGDGWGINVYKCLCAPDSATKFTARISGDCIDNDEEIYPSAKEKCNNKDDDCNGEVDEERQGGECDSDGYQVFYYDQDKDGFYKETVDYKCLCAPSGNYRGTMPGDCNDNEASVNPSAIEKCNNIDDDCDTETDEERTNEPCATDGYTLYYLDTDGDTYGVTEDSKCLCTESGNYRATRGDDCDDSDSARYSGASVCGIDADCDGSLLDSGEVCDDANDVRWDGCTDCLYLDFQVNSWTTGYQHEPSIARLENGGFVVAWSGSGEGDDYFGIFAQRFDAEGKKVGSEFRVNTWTTDGQATPSIASQSDGGFVVVWLSVGQASSLDVYGQRFDVNGNKIGSEFRVNTWTTDVQMDPSIAPLSGGGFVVVWTSRCATFDCTSQDGSGDGVYGQRYNSFGVKNGTEFRVNTWTTDDQEAPSVAPLREGGFVVVWQSRMGDWDIYGQRFDVLGNKAGGEFLVNTWTTGSDFDPAVATLSNGDFIVVWSGYGQSDNAGVYAQIFDANGNKIGIEFLVNTWTTNQQSQPSVTPLSDGGFVVVWTDRFRDGSADDVVAQRFDANGNKVGSEFIVNTWTSSGQERPSICSLKNGGFAVVWESFDQDGSYEGVFGRIFAQ